jgi:hypothetical protein
VVVVDVTVRANLFHVKHQRRARYVDESAVSTDLIVSRGTVCDQETGTRARAQARFAAQNAKIGSTPAPSSGKDG